MLAGLGGCASGENKMVSKNKQVESDFIIVFVGSFNLKQAKVKGFFQAVRICWIYRTTALFPFRSNLRQT
jgi:hypothetical protein